MEIAIEEQIAELGRMTVTQLRQKYAEIFGEETFGAFLQLSIGMISGGP